MEGTRGEGERVFFIFTEVVVVSRLAKALNHKNNSGVISSFPL